MVMRFSVLSLVFICSAVFAVDWSYNLISPYMGPVPYSAVTRGSGGNFVTDGNWGAMYTNPANIGSAGDQSLIYHFEPYRLESVKLYNGSPVVNLGSAGYEEYIKQKETNPELDDLTREYRLLRHTIAFQRKQSSGLHNVFTLSYASAKNDRPMNPVVYDEVNLVFVTQEDMGYSDNQIQLHTGYGAQKEIIQKGKLALNIGGRYSFDFYRFPNFGDPITSIQNKFTLGGKVSLAQIRLGVLYGIDFKSEALRSYKLHRYGFSAGAESSESFTGGALQISCEASFNNESLVDFDSRLTELAFSGRGVIKELVTVRTGIKNSKATVGSLESSELSFHSGAGVLLLKRIELNGYSVAYLKAADQSDKKSKPKFGIEAGLHF